MPALTICPQVFNTDIFDDCKRAADNKGAVKSTTCEYMAATSQWCGVRIKLCCKNSTSILDEVNVIKQINKSDAYSDEVLNDLKKFPKILTENGVCFSYNMEDVTEIYNMEAVHDDFQSYRDERTPKGEWTAERGFFSENSSFPEHLQTSKGFYFTLYPVHSDYVCGHSVYVYVHLPNEFPTDSRKVLSINYGSMPTFLLTVKSYRTDDALRAYSADIRKCYFEGERKLEFFKIYSKAHCEVECYTNVTIKVCGCVPFYMPRNKTTQICKYSQLKCIRNLANVYRTESRPTCNCFPSCNDVKYEVELFDANALARVISRFNGTEITFATINFVVEEFEKFLTYKIQNFIADIGGLLGLFLGCSLLSLVEIVYFVITALIKAIGRKDSNKTANIIQVEASIDRKVLRLEAEMKKLSNNFENIVKNEILKRVVKLEQSERENSQKMTNLEKNALIMADF